MTFIKGVFFFFSSFLIYLAVSFAEYFTLGILFTGFIDSFVLRVGIVSLMLFVINPFITYGLARRLSIRLKEN